MDVIGTGMQKETRQCASQATYDLTTNGSSACEERLTTFLYEQRNAKSEGKHED